MVQREIFVRLFILVLILFYEKGTVAQMIDGLMVTNNDFKYQVLIIKKDGACGGAIIDEFHILTAAHCVYMVPLCEIYLITRMTPRHGASRIINGVNKIHIHSGFTPGLKSTNDIAVVKLNAALKFGNHIGKIDLPTTDICYCDVCVTAGWGLTERGNAQSAGELRWAQLAIAMPSLCERLGVHPEDNEFCAYDLVALRAPSHGDSGSPLRCGDKLAGIVSFGWSDPKIPTIFTNVYKHLDFIHGRISG